MNAELVKSIIASVLRHALTGVGTYLVAHGIVTQDQFGLAIGGAVTILAGLAWSYLSKTSVFAKLGIALALPAGTSMEALNRVVSGQPQILPPKPPAALIVLFGLLLCGSARGQSRFMTAESRFSIQSRFEQVMRACGSDRCKAELRGAYQEARDEYNAALNQMLADPEAGQSPPAYLPPTSSPGATNPDVTEATKAATICNPHWSTKSIRPPVSFTNKLKLQQMAALGYNLPDSGKTCMPRSGNPGCYELDHLVSLEIGGAPSDPRNLWPEPWHIAVNGMDYGAKTKDVLENRLHSLICSGAISLLEAQAAIRTDWIAAYQKYVNPSLPAIK